MNRPQTPKPTNIQPTKTEHGDPLSDSDELLERGRLTLQAIQYHEREARYNAAAASLQAAMIQAENGNAVKLQEWLESESHQFDADIKFSVQTKETGVANSPPVRSLRLDTNQPQPGIHFGTQLNPRNDGAETNWEAIRTAPSELDSKNVDAKLSSKEDSSKTNSVISEQVIAPVPIKNSPWECMEKGAIARLASETSKVAPTSEELVSENGCSQVLLDSQVEEPDSPKELPAQLELPTELVVALDDLGANSSEPQKKVWWKAPHVWISLTAHAILVVCLSLIVATVAAEPKMLAVVSAPIEAENVLLETPMEMISELETTAEPMQSMPAPSLAGLASEMASDIALDKSAIATGSMPSQTTSMSSALNGASSEMSQASMAGSKMLSGAEFFGVKATGNTFVYIVDSSPSMRRDGAFDAAKAEIMRSLQSMKPKQRYFISFFGKEIDPMVFQTGVAEKYPVYAKPENLTKTIEWLNRVVIQKDGLPPNNALTEAIALQPDGIFLLFDGDTKVDVAKHLRKVNRSDDILSAGLPKVPIHVVHFFQDEFQKQMRQVAEENGGTYRFVPRPQRPSKK